MIRTFLAGTLFAAAFILPGDALAQAEPASTIVQDYEPDPAIWIVQDEDTRIYLLGTIHVLPKGFRWRSDRLNAIVAEADELVVESTDDDLDGLDSPIAQLVGSLKKRPLVSARMSPANGRKWRALGESLGMEADYFDRLPPLLALFGLGFTTDEVATGSDIDFGVETVLEAEFRAAGKPIRSIENAGDVFASLLELDEAVLIKELDRAMSGWDGKSPGSDFFRPTGKSANAVGDYPALEDEHAWAQGGEMDMREEMASSPVFGQALSKRLIDQRNSAWARWLEQRLETPGTVLLAVGAAHLAGETSVQAMLARRGITSRRIN